MNSVGFYGKLAGRGDFVSRGLPNTVLEPGDRKSVVEGKK
ncbi:DUF2094 domain-containing protein, partial [Pseudomonas sp. AF1]